MELESSQFSPPRVANFPTGGFGHFPTGGEGNFPTDRVGKFPADIEFGISHQLGISELIN